MEKKSLRDTRTFRLLRAKLADKYYPLCVQPWHRTVLKLLAGHRDQRMPRGALGPVLISQWLLLPVPGLRWWCRQVDTVGGGAGYLTYKAIRSIDAGRPLMLQGESVFSKRRNVPLKGGKGEWGKVLWNLSAFFFFLKTRSVFWNQI